MNNINQRIAALSPEQRAIFERELNLGNISDSNILSIPRRAGPGLCAPSFGQERFWFLDQLSPDSAVYNLANAFRITGALDVEALESALRHIVSRHEALRTTVSVVDDDPQQVVAETWSFTMPVVDLRQFPSVSRGGTGRALQGVSRGSNQTSYQVPHFRTAVREPIRRRP